VPILRTPVQEEAAWEWVLTFNHTLVMLYDRQVTKSLYIASNDTRAIHKRSPVRSQPVHGICSTRRRHRLHLSHNVILSKRLTPICCPCSTSNMAMTELDCAQRPSGIGQPTPDCSVYHPSAQVSIGAEAQILVQILGIGNGVGVVSIDVGHGLATARTVSAMS
jgi:hypothetical protein